MATPGSELFFAVRLKLIGYYFGQFCLIIAGFNTINLIIAIFSAPWSISASYAILIISLILFWLALRRLHVSGQMQMNEAIVLVALVFLVTALIMTIPLMVSGITFIDAFFETTSAVTTTGLSTIHDIGEKPFIFSFSRAWMQWYGGLGIVVFSLALVVRPGMSALRLGSLEESEDLVGSTSSHAKRVITTYSMLTMLGLILWLFLGGSLRDGLLYTLSAVSTGGFAPSAGSLADLPHLRLAWIVTLSSMSGAIPLVLYQHSWSNGPRALINSVEFRLLLALTLSFSAFMVYILHSQGATITYALHHAPLMVISAQTTSGFSSLNVETLSAGAKITLIMAMSIGGGVGSTAGGFKLLRLLILCGMVLHFVRTMCVSSNTILHQRLGKRTVDANEVQDALMIILLFISTVFLSWIPFLVYGYPPLDALFEVVSATATVGLSSGITQQNLPSALKSVLCLDMLLGRLEFVAWLVFFYHRTWFGRKRENK